MEHMSVNNGYQDAETLQAWQAVVEAFVQTADVRAFQQAEAKMSTHEAIQTLCAQIKAEQKALVNAKHYAKAGAVQAHEVQIVALEAELALIPLWHQYKQLQATVNDQLQAIIQAVEANL